MSNNGNNSSILNATKTIYESVINKVCQKLEEDQDNETLAVEIIDQLKQVWKKKIEERKVYILDQPIAQQSNEGTQKKEGSAANQSKQSGSSLQSNNQKSELSDEKTNELYQTAMNTANQIMDQQNKPLAHPHPNAEIQGISTVKKIKTEENSGYQPNYSTSTKMEEISPNFGASDHDDYDVHRFQHDSVQMSLHPTAAVHKQQEAPVETLEFQKSHSHRNVKVEEEIDFTDAVRNQHQEEEENEEDQNDQLEQERQRENKNEQFLNEDSYQTDSHICGYYSVMKKKTAKKFKISFEKMIVSVTGKDYILSSLSGDLEW